MIITRSLLFPVPLSPPSPSPSTPRPFQNPAKPTKPSTGKAKPVRKAFQSEGKKRAAARDLRAIENMLLAKKPYAVPPPTEPSEPFIPSPEAFYPAPSNGEPLNPLPQNPPSREELRQQYLTQLKEEDERKQRFLAFIDGRTAQDAAAIKYMPQETIRMVKLVLYST